MDGHKGKKEGQKKINEPKTKSWLSTPEVAFMKKLLESKVIYVLIVFSLILYLITHSSIFSLLSVLLVLLLLIGESLVGVAEHGFKKELQEVGIAIVAALVIWFGAGFLLGTQAPLNAIVSCSMLPNLERGDLVILQGGEPKGTDIYVDSFDFTDISVNVSGVGEYKTNVSLTQYCAYFPDSVPCKTYFNYPEKVTERYGSLTFKHGWCTVLSRGFTGEIPCVRSVVADGKEYPYTISGDTIVYTTLPTDLFSKYTGPKEIIHRMVYKVHAGNQVFYLTKGDNNDKFDLQYDNAPATPQKTSGKVILRIPYLGYFKLFLFGYLDEPAGCDRYFSKR
ncbi:MAG: hypothetical protein V1909_02965 [Candidatus Micrarchaeota archaeon]